MSVSSVLPLSQYQGLANAMIDPRLQVKEDGSSCWTTALKIAGIIGALIASIGSFVFLGPIVGLVVTLIAGTAALLIFNSCCGNSHDHSHDHSIQTLWYQRIFSFFPMDAHQHGPPREGPHVPVGCGHVSPPPARPWYNDWFSYVPSGIRNMNDGHVPVGQGGHGQGSHVPVGRGGHIPNPHDHGHGGRGHGPTSAPPPSGPFGHVPVGRRRN